MNITAIALSRLKSAKAGRVAVLFLLAATVLVVITLFAIEMRRRHSLYWYDVRQNYRFSFNPKYATSVPIEISPESFVFPDVPVTWDTALVRLRVAGDWTSYWFEPSITIGTGTNAQRQFFERGARGDRYLLLTPGVRAGARVQLRGTHLEWPSQTGELLLLRSPSPASGPVLVLAPHPDDAEIAAFGLYSSHDSFVVTVTPGNYVDGSYAHIYADEMEQDTLKARVRTWDSLMVPSWGGVPPERTANLGYLGTSLERLYSERHAAPADRSAPDPRFGRYRQGAIATLLQGNAATPTWASLVQDLTILLRSVRPGMVVAPHPTMDAATDHQLTTMALLEALEASGSDDVTLLLYTNHHVLSEYFPFGPADAVVTLPPWFDDALPVTSVYSYQLDGTRQLDKLFALDAMHDLRDAPQQLWGGPTDRFVLRLGRSIGGLIRDPVSDYSYYRRAVRPNELYFVYTPDDRKALVSFEARHRPRLARTGSVLTSPAPQVSSPGGQ